MKIQSAVERECMSKDHFLNVGWKALPLGHWCVVNQHRNDRNTALQRVSDFQTNKIIRIVYSARSVRLLASPMRPDHRDNDIGPFDCVFDLLAKVQSRSDRVKIHKNIPLAEFRL